MFDEEILLTDEEVGHFIARGYLVLRNSISAERHGQVLDKIRSVYRDEGNPGNNILPRIPEIQDLFDTPVVKGALKSILGPDYYMHPHRHCHYNSPGKQTPQAWHKDGYWTSVRCHRPWWAMIFYYTQDVTEEMGPTGIMPGSQYAEKKPGDDAETLMPAGKAGTMVLVHFDLWHRASHNLSNLDRYMLKFQFIRLKAPEYPTWHQQSDTLVLPENVNSIPSHRLIWNDIWNWMLGNRPASLNADPNLMSLEQDGSNGAVSRSADMPVNRLLGGLHHADGNVRLLAAEQLGLMGQAGEAAIPDLEQALHDEYEPVALNAAYALANMGEAGTRVLLKQLEHGSGEVARLAAHALPASSTPDAEGLVSMLENGNALCAGYAAFVLGMMGYQARVAVPALVRASQSDSVWVARNSLEALGLIRQPSSLTVSAVHDALLSDRAEPLALGNGENGDASDSKPYETYPKYIKDKVKYTAALSMLRLGDLPEAGQAIPGLKNNLEHADRYVKAYCIEALTHIRRDEAVDILIHYFRKSRWCPDTSKASTF